MYRIININTGDVIGMVDEVFYVRRKESSGSLVKANPSNAEGIAYRSVPYNLSGRDGVGAEITVVVNEFDGAEEMNTLMGTMFPNENGETASQSYAKGKYFYHNGDFCKAKTSIPTGARFTLNTNYTVTTIAAELFSLLNS